MLYSMSETRRGNSLGIFGAYGKSEENPEVHALVRYLIN